MKKFPMALPLADHNTPLWDINGHAIEGQNLEISVIAPIADNRGRGWSLDLGQHFEATHPRHIVHSNSNRAAALSVLCHKRTFRYSFPVGANSLAMLLRY